MLPDAPTAFFSYSREDSEFALRLAEDLKAAGADVWLDQLDIAPGQRWARAVQGALQNSPRVLVILSPASVNSNHVEDEVNFALDEQKTVIPVFYKDCKVPFQLRPLQYVDFRTDYAYGLKIMLKTLGVKQQSVGSPAAAPTGRRASPPTAMDAAVGGKAVEDQLEEEGKQEAETEDVRTAVQSDVGKIQTIFSGVGLALSDLNTSIVNLRLDLLEYTKHNPQVEEYLGDSLPESLKGDVLAFTSTLGKLREALGQVQTDNLARVCWVKAGAAHTLNSLAYIQSQLESRGFPRSEASVPISDIPLILQFLSLAPRKLQSLKFEPLITAILQTNLADAVGKPYDHEALRTFMFGGNLIAAIGGDKVHVPLGAAILFDIYQSIPDAASLRDALKEKYATYSGGIESVQLAFVPEQFVSGDFRFAVEELRKRQDVLVLDTLHRHRESQ